MTKRNDILEELEQIAQKSDGLIKPVDVVEFAKNPDTALHSQFEWDDQKASDKYRIWQARQIIKVHVDLIVPDVETKHHVFVSMSDDRAHGGGYRFLVDVMSDEEQRGKLLAQAHREFRLWQERYKMLKELEPVFVAMDGVQTTIVEVKPKPVVKSRRPAAQVAAV